MVFIWSLLYNQLVVLWLGSSQLIILCDSMYALLSAFHVTKVSMGPFPCLENINAKPECVFSKVAANQLVVGSLTTVDRWKEESSEDKVSSRGKKPQCLKL